MKKALLFSLFTVLSFAAFAQYNGCGVPREDNANSYNYSNTTYKTSYNDAKVDFVIFPNPTVDYFVLDAKSLQEGNASKVYIYNTFGQMVRTFTVAKDTRYDVSDLRDGLYLIQFTDAKDKTITTRKLNKSNVPARF